MINSSEWLFVIALIEIQWLINKTEKSKFQFEYPKIPFHCNLVDQSTLLMKCFDIKCFAWNINTDSWKKIFNWCCLKVGNDTTELPHT